MFRLLSAAAFAVVLPLAAQANVTVTSFSGGDAAFNKSVIGDSSLGEFRWGNNANNGDWEVGVGDSTSVPGEFNQAQNVWTDLFSFFLEYDGTSTLDLSWTNILTGVSSSLSYGPTTTPNSATVDLDKFDFIALRADGRFGDATIRNLVFNDGTAAHTLGTDLAASGSVEYLFLNGVTPGNAWSLAGTIDFTTNPASNNSGSRPSFQIKVAAVPVPAALPLGLLALAGLGLYGRRQRKVQAA